MGPEKVLETLACACKGLVKADGSMSPKLHFGGKNPPLGMGIQIRSLNHNGVYDFYVGLCGQWALSVFKHVYFSVRWQGIY